MAIQQQQSSTQSDMSLIQAIEMVAKDKGIDKARLVKTVEEAILKAAQSAFGATRELEARFNEETGQVDLFQYMTVVDDPSDEDREIGLEEARAAGLEAELGEELGFQIFWHPADAKKAAEQDREFGDLLQREAGARVVRAHRRADGQAGPHPARPGRGARPHLQRVQGQEGRAHQGGRPALREGQQPHRRPRAHRGDPPLPRADPARGLPAGRPHRRVRQGHRPRGARPAGHPVARRPASSSRSSSRPRSRRSTRASCASSPAPASPARARRSR